MGRIKTKQVKSISSDIAENHLSEFSGDFDKNKEIIDSLIDVPSKKLRNIIVGYMTRLARTNKNL